MKSRKVIESWSVNKSARNGRAGAESAQRRNVLQIDGKRVRVEAEKRAHRGDALLNVLRLEAIQRLKHERLRLGACLKIEQILARDFADRIAVFRAGAAVWRAGAAVEAHIRRRAHVRAHVLAGLDLVGVVDRRRGRRVVQRIDAHRTQRVDRMRGLRRKERVKLRNVLLHLVQAVLHDLVLRVRLQRLLILSRVLSCFQL